MNPRLVLPIVLTWLLASASMSSTLDVVVDARELPRRFLHSQISLDLPAGRSALLYVKWVPGIHAPRGPVQNLAGFAVRDDDGAEIPWTRDRLDPFRFLVDAPAAGRYTVSMTYVTNQPSTNSRSIDSYGYPSQGVINWNTVVVYPEGAGARDIEVRASLMLPDDWSHGSALELDGTRDDTLIFEPTDLENFLDKPLIAGRHLTTFELANTDQARWLLHVSADEAEFIPAEDDSLLGPFRNLCHEAEALFHRTHFDEYHILLSLSDDLNLGVEHRSSSLNSDDPDTFQDKAWIETGVEVLIPHEVSHAWCGKYRRPAGMYTDDFQKPKDTELLWVYEGLDQYLEKVLTARCGFRTPEVARESFAYNVANMIHQKGRHWRPLSDTAVSAHTLRGGSTYWSFLRRGQDYYNEGVFIWLEVDAHIRRLTNSERSLDDFCAAFFATGDPDAHAVPFDREEIIRLLDELAPFDWGGLFEARVDEAPGDEIPEGLELSGWTLAYSDEPSSLFKVVERIRSSVRLYDSIGFSVSKDGTTGSIVPGSATDRAGIVKGLEILGVNGLRFTPDRLRDAVGETKETGKIELLVDVSGHLETYVIEYDGGHRYYTLERNEDEPDLLSDILAPRRRP